jgi:hypothetical protein
MSLVAATFEDLPGKVLTVRCHLYRNRQSLLLFGIDRLQQHASNLQILEIRQL